MVPVVIESTSRGERCYDIYSRLLKDRIIFLGEEITSELAREIVAQMLVLHMDNKRADINLYIMSPGGDVTASLAIYDTMQHIPNDVATYCVGQAASSAAFLLCAGKKGKRFALPSSSIMIHQPWGGAGGTAKDIEIQSKEMNRLKNMFYERMSKHTGKDIKDIEKDCEWDHYMSAEDAVSYGLVDKILVEARKR